MTRDIDIDVAAPTPENFPMAQGDYYMDWAFRGPAGPGSEREVLRWAYSTHLRAQWGVRPPGTKWYVPGYSVFSSRRVER